MKKPFLRLSETMTPQARNAFQIAAAIAGAHFIALPYYLYLILSTSIVQFSILTVITLALAVSISMGAFIIWRGRPTTGMIMVLVILAVAYPPVSAFLASGLGSVLGIALLFVGPMSAFQVLPRRPARIMTVITVASGLASLLLDMFSPALRPSLPGVFIQLLATAVVILLAVLVFRQFRNYSMATKLVVSFVAVAIIAIGIVSFITYRITSVQITERVGANLSSAAEGAALEIASDLDDSMHTLQVLTLNKFLQETLQTANATGTSSQSTLARLDQQWANSSDSSALVRAVLNNELSNELRKFHEKFPAYAEVFVTDKYGAIVASKDRTSDYFQADEEWWQTAWSNGNGATYIGQPEFDESSNTMSINIAMPVVTPNSTELAGVLRVTLDVTSLTKVVDAVEIGKTGLADLIFRDQTYHAGELGLTPVDPGELDEITPLFGTYGESSFESVPSLLTLMPVKAHISEHENAIDQLGWSVIVHQSIAEARQPVTSTTRTILLSAIIIVLGVALAALGMAQILSRPIVRLTAVAEQISAGDINAQANVEFGDETGALATAFNTMTSRLRELLESLEQRVAARTHNLELAAEVVRSVTQVRALDVMLKDACELILKEFDLYYVQVYLTDPGQKNLVLEAGSGEVGAQLLGRGHGLPLNTGSINGRAAVEKHSVVISDTTQSRTFKQNSLLPDTRSEMATPLIVANKVVGVLDMQSSSPGALSEEILPALEALAGQLAIAVQNANLLAEAEQARAEVETQARRLVRQGWSEHLDAIHKPEQIAFVFNHNEVTPLAEVNETQLPENGKAISVPIAVTGESLGSLVVEFEDETQREQTSELVNVVARQVAQQIENLRLLESAERYRSEAEQAARRLTIEGWKSYMESRSGESLGYVYDLNQVRPVEGEQPAAQNVTTLPLKARDEQIGKLAVQNLAPEDSDALELAQAVAERLGAHLESLRLLEDTRQGQLELDERARQLAAVAEVSTASSRELDIQKMLETVVHLTQRKFDLYHAHIFLCDEITGELKIAACGWMEGEEHEGIHGTAPIPLQQEQSLVARAARNRQAVIVNNVRSDPGWLPNPLLPDTQAEMAVPLVIGDQVLGVLDVQSDRLNAFSEDDANVQTTLASQVAAALQNARSFARAQKQAKQEGMLNAISQKIQTATTVEAVLQIAARELGHALGAPLTIAQLGLKGNGSGNTEPQSGVEGQSN